MRPVVVGVFTLLLARAAVADEPAATPPAPAPKQVEKAARQKVPLRVIRILADSQQALLYDRTKTQHVLARVGEIVAGYTVDSIDDDEVTLLAPNGAEVVLAVPGVAREPVPDPRADTPAAATRTKGAGAGGAGATDAAGADARPAATQPGESKAPATAPAGDATNKMPEDPYRTDEPASGVAPEDPYASDVRPAGVPSWIDDGGAPVTAPDATTPTVKAPAPPPVDELPPSVATSPTPAPIASPAGASIVSPIVSRREVDAALADFAILTKSITGAFTATGVKLDAVATASVFAKAGLRAGDLIASVDGRPLRSLDDAADLYARASTARLVTVLVLRAGKPTTLRVTIR